ncbi:MAG: hypothetical protein ABIP82_06795 [Nitrospirales bacterium]
MKIVLDIDPAQTIQPQWTKLLGIDLVPPPVAALHPEADLFATSKYEECIHKENEL